MTDIPHTISTGNKKIDKAIAMFGSKIVGTVVKDPKAKLALKTAEKLYPYLEKGGAALPEHRRLTRKLVKEGNDKLQLLPNKVI